MTLPRILLFAALAATALSPVAASSTAQAELPSAIVQRGAIIAAVIPNYPPLEFKDPATGELTGFDIEIGQAIAKQLGVKITWQETSFEQMLPSIATGRIDIVISGMTDLASRHESATFVDYMKTGPQFFVGFARKAEFPDMTALCGKAVGASRRTNTPKEIAAWSDENCVKAGKEAIRFVGTEGSADARTQLKQNRIDAAVQGSETLPYIMSQEPDRFAPVGAPFGVSYNGIAIKKDEAGLQQAIAGALDQLIKSGDYAKLLKKWNLNDQGIEKAMINAGK